MADDGLDSLKMGIRRLFRLGVSQRSAKLATCKSQIFRLATLPKPRDKEIEAIGSN